MLLMIMIRILGPVGLAPPKVVVPGLDPSVGLVLDRLLDLLVPIIILKRLVLLRQRTWVARVVLNVFTRLVTPGWAILCLASSLNVCSMVLPRNALFRIIIALLSLLELCSPTIPHRVPCIMEQYRLVVTLLTEVFLPRVRPIEEPTNMA